MAAVTHRNIDQDSISATTNVSALNNLVVSMRPIVAAAKVRLTRRISRDISLLRSKSLDLNPKWERKRQRLLKQIKVLKALKRDKVSKFCLGNTCKLSDVSPEDTERIVLTKLYIERPIQTVVKKFRNEHSDWKSLTDFMQSKNTGRHFKKPKHKRHGKIKEIQLDKSGAGKRKESLPRVPVTGETLSSIFTSRDNNEIDSESENEVGSGPENPFKKPTFSGSLNEKYSIKSGDRDPEKPTEISSQSSNKPRRKSPGKKSALSPRSLHPHSVVQRLDLTKLVPDSDTQFVTSKSGPSKVHSSYSSERNLPVLPDAEESAFNKLDPFFLGGVAERDDEANGSASVNFMDEKLASESFFVDLSAKRPSKKQKRSRPVPENIPGLNRAGKSAAAYTTCSENIVIQPTCKAEHPSWEAKKALKRQQIDTKFQGKRTVFNEDDD